MDALRDLLACPACGSVLAIGWQCPGCGARYTAPDGIPDLRLGGDTRTDAVRRFYEYAPFPGYRPRDSLASLYARADRSKFARLLDEAIPGDARIVEIGCGTGQMSLYLTRADRLVIGADLTRASLLLAQGAARRFGLARVQFVETDLRRPGLRAGAFDVVYASGVLHHTPNPRASFARIATLARPGGIIVVGLYNAFARIPLRLRRLVARISGYRWIPFDPVLRERDGEPARREALLRDQYLHPEEHPHNPGGVQNWFRENSVQYVRAYPSAPLRDAPVDLFTAAGDTWRAGAWWDGHFMPIFAIKRSTMVAAEMAVRGLIGLAGAALLIVLRRPIAAVLSRATIGGALRIFLAVVLALGTSELILRAHPPHPHDADPLEQEPRRHADPWLGWEFVPARSVAAEEAGRRVSYSFDAAGHRVPALGTTVDVERPTLLFTGESIIAGFGLAWEETIPDRAKDRRGVAAP